MGLRIRRSPTSPSVSPQRGRRESLPHCGGACACIRVCEREMGVWVCGCVCIYSMHACPQIVWNHRSDTTLAYVISSLSSSRALVRFFERSSLSPSLSLTLSLSLFITYTHTITHSCELTLIHIHTKSMISIEFRLI